MGRGPDLKPRKRHGTFMWQGYPLMEYTRDYGPIFMHRVVMERKLGRQLRDDEHVHHKDGNILNYSEDNLEVLTISQHATLHRTGFRLAVCKRGHPRTPDNLSGNSCKACMRLVNAARYRRLFS